ncbi:MAG TPA: M1 family aminopeptidase [Bacteroidota bacterium]|nr:M1 family aminopeptidase [Bacteroidota bacterium]
MPPRITVILLLILLPAVRASAQRKPSRDAGAEKILIQSEMERYRARAPLAQRATLADDNYDVTWYELRLRISTNPGQITGVVAIRAASVIDGLSSVRIDLSDSLSVDTIVSPNGPLSYTRASNMITVYLDSSYLAGEIFTIHVAYHGLPAPSGFGSFVFSVTAQGAPWIWSLSQPYGAKDWWPCKDQLTDKADSVDVIVTCADTLRVGSNGTLAGVVNNGDGTATTHWKERYPIATYLVSVAISNYVQFSNWFHYAPGDSMEVLNYVLPAKLAAALLDLPRTVNMLEIYSDLFGLYPFIEEKYGHCDFGWGGAMEHQTMTSTTSYSENLIAHELAHQWFGDMITCRSWADLWLNEGFATYNTGLYRERAYGAMPYYNYMTVHLNAARSAVGTLYVQDTSNVGNLFSGSRVYSKGASVLHMLRHVMGDSIFFDAMYSYANDPAVRFGTATTADFRRVCEAVSGTDLGYFFDQWVYGEKFPTYRYGWTSSPTMIGHRVDLRVVQTTGTADPAAFTMPVDVRISGTGWDTTIVVVDSLGTQDFSFDSPVAPASVMIDPDRWILRILDSVSYAVLGVEEPAAYPRSPFLLQNYPNPFNPSTTIGYGVAGRSRVTLKIFNILGEEVARVFSGTKEPGTYDAVWNASGRPGGVYVAEFVSEPVDRSGPPVRLVRKLLYIR